MQAEVTLQKKSNYVMMYGNFQLRINLDFLSRIDNSLNAMMLA